MIAPNDVKAAIIAKLKANTALMAAMEAIKTGASAEVREHQWAGRTFIYPAIRIDLLPQAEVGNPPCYSSQPFNAYIYTEDDSSFHCGSLLALVDTALIRRSISASSFHTGIIESVSSIPPARQTERVWRATGQYTTMLYGGNL
jgi:hypothetical protein